MAAKVFISSLLPSILFFAFFNPPHLNPQSSLLSSANYIKPYPFATARVTSLRPDPNGDLDARTTSSFSKTKEWRDPSRFHPWCQSEGLQLHGKEQKIEVGDGTTAFPLDGGGSSSHEDVDVSLLIGLGPVVRFLFVGPHVLDPLFYFMYACTPCGLPVRGPVCIKLG